MKRQILLSFIILTFGIALQAQDPIFSQFYAAPLQLSPAFAGNTYAPRISAIYRRQWPSISAYSTYAISYEQFVEPLNSGFGFMLESDDQGDGLYKTTRFGANYAYRIRVSDEFNLKFGIEAGVHQVTLDWFNLVFLDQLDPINGQTDPGGNPYVSNEIPPESFNRAVFDVGAGLLAYGKSFYAGVSLKHMNTPNESFLFINDNLTKGMPMRFSAHGGMQFIVKRGNKRKLPTFISPNLLYVRQADQGQINGGVYAGIGPFFAGGWFRHSFGNSDAVIGLVGVRQGIFKIGYSYDVTVSELDYGGAHEISVVLNFDDSEAVKSRRRNQRYNDCFQLFR